MTQDARNSEHILTAQSNIDLLHRLAWAENIGWTSWRSESEPDQGVFVGESFLVGFVWAENIGWINVGNGPADGTNYANLDEADFGVNIDPLTGDLSGYGWAQNAGWISFDTASTGADRARFDPAELRFRGYAWGENIGWMNLDDATHFIATHGFVDIPTVTAWGMATLMILVLAAGTVMIKRRGLAAA